SLDVLPPRLLRERPHAADRIVVEVGDFGRHEAVDPSFGFRDVGEDSGPVAVARVNVDDGGARSDSCEPDQLGLPGWAVHRDLRYGRESWPQTASNTSARAIHLRGPHQCLRVDVLPDAREPAVTDRDGEDPVVLER